MDSSSWKLPKHAESSYAVDARRNAEGAASAEGLIYNALLFVTVQESCSD